MSNNNSGPNKDLQKPDVATPRSRNLTPPLLTHEELTAFEDKIGPSDENGCRPWSGALNKEGRGRHSVHGTTWYAYVLALLLSGASVRRGWPVRHLCGNPQCCEVSHLSAQGGQSANNRDTVRHGRHRSAVLTEADALKIRKVLNSSSPPLQKELAEKYGVTPQSISAVALGKTFPNAGGPIKSSRKRLESQQASVKKVSSASSCRKTAGPNPRRVLERIERLAAQKLATAHEYEREQLVETRRKVVARAKEQAEGIGARIRFEVESITSVAAALVMSMEKDAAKFAVEVSIAPRLWDERDEKLERAAAARAELKAREKEHLPVAAQKAMRKALVTVIADSLVPAGQRRKDYINSVYATAGWEVKKLRSRFKSRGSIPVAEWKKVMVEHAVRPIDKAITRVRLTR